MEKLSSSSSSGGGTEVSTEEEEVPSGRAASHGREEEDIEFDGVFSQCLIAKRLREIAKSKLNPTERKFIDETGFGNLKSISPFIVLHDPMEWLAMNIDIGKCEVIVFTRDMVKKVFNIPSGNRTVELYKRHEQCDLRNIYHKNSRAPNAHTIDVLHKARNDDGDTTKRSWVLLALETVLTPRTGNMVPIEYMKSLEDIENILCVVISHYLHGSFDFSSSFYQRASIYYSLPRACFVQQSDFDIVWEYEKNKLALGKSSFGKCRFRPVSETTYAALYPEGGVIGVDVGNNSTAAQDVDCDDTQDCGAADVNINGKRDEIGAKDNILKILIQWKMRKVQKKMCLPPHLAEMYEKHTKLNVAELKGATNCFVQMLQAMNCRRMGKILKIFIFNDAPKADERGGSKQTSTSKASDESGGSTQSYSRNVVDQPTIDKVVVESAEGARINHSSRSAHELCVGTPTYESRPSNERNVVEIHAESSGDANQANAQKEQVEGGEDVEHDPQLSHLDHSAMASVGGHWSDAPSMSLFQEGTEEYNWWTGVPSANVHPNASNHDNTATTQRTQKSFGSPRPQEELVVLLSNREPSPDRDEEKARLKEEKKVKSKKGAGNPISGGAKYKKIKTDDKTEAMYQYFSMKRYKMLPFIRTGDFHITYSNFHKSLKPRAQMCNEVMSLFIESFNIERFSSSNKQKKFAFFVLMNVSSSFLLPCTVIIFNFVFTQKVFNPSVCGKELRRLFFSVYPDGHWIFCVINLLHKQFNLFDSIDNGNLDVAARNLFTNLKRVVAKELDFTMDLNSFKENKTKLKYLQQSTHSDCGYFGDLYFENFDGKRMEDFNKQNMLDVHKYHSSKFFYRPFNKVSPADVYKRL
ncbi:hypothetical protein ZWY2020_035893 [Hordeum vulgare]|nr:hypothetical protein ZWY2020_035893 [Hordeum vulgare]